MNKRNWIWLIALGGLLVLGLVYVFSGGNKYEWNPTMKINDTKPQPYNLDFFYKSLHKKFNDNVTEIDVKEPFEKHSYKLFTDPQNTVYLYCGKFFNLNKIHEKILDSFVETGGTVFFSSPTIPDTFFEKFNLLYTQYSPYHSDTVVTEFYNPDIKPAEFSFVSKYKNRTLPFSWNFIDVPGSMWGNGQVAAISGKKGDFGRINYIDFFRIKQGAGKYYFHLNTLMLSNLYLTQKETRPYFNHVFSHLNGKKLIIDHTVRLISIDDKVFSSDRESFIDFILANKALRYAWYLLVLGVFTFLVVSGKRKQAEIPVLEKPKNNTFRFIQTISYFYWKKNSAGFMFERECTQFLQYVKENLNIRIDAEKEFPTDLIAEKSGVEKTLIVNISKYLDRKKSWDPSKSLADLCRETGQFYEEHKKNNGKYQRTRVAL